MLTMLPLQRVYVLCNDVFKIGEYDDWRPINGSEYDDEGNVIEFFQSFIISKTGAEILQSYTDETVLYNEEYNLYVWRIAHWGTSWDYVLTDIECEKEVK